MKALAIKEPYKAEVVNRRRPIPGKGEVLLKMHLVGFCGSDLNTFRGKNSLVKFPRILGHEAAAKIVAIGKDVPKNIQLDMNVTISPYTACGQCSSCLKGRSNACENNQTLGVQRDGIISEYAVIPWQKIFPSKKLSMKELALVEPLAVGFHASARGEVSSSDTVAVFGCGAVGLGVISGAASRGARVIAIGRNDEKLMLAKKIGATDTINSGKEDLGVTLRELSKNGPDVIIEAVGEVSTYKAAAEQVASCGKVVYVGYVKEPVAFDTARDFVRKEIDIRGSRNATSSDFSGVIRMLENNRFPVEELITSIVTLEKAGQSLKEWDDDTSRVVRILVNLENNQT